MSRRGHMVEVVREVVLLQGGEYRVGGKEGGEEEEEEGVDERRSCLGQK